jgi:hypothetical protein
VTATYDGVRRRLVDGLRHSGDGMADVEFRTHQCRRLDCRRCGTILSTCNCAPEATEHVVACNICISLPDYDADSLKRQNARR